MRHQRRIYDAFELTRFLALLCARLICNPAQTRIRISRTRTVRIRSGVVSDTFETPNGCYSSLHVKL